METSRAKNILLVDDQKNFLTILAAELGACRNGFRILTAENGKTALRVIEADRVDLVVTDLNMPMMNGYDLISHVKMNYPHIPVIVISSFLYPESEERLTALGVSNYIDKQSFSVSRLEEMILKIWQGV